jgi:hypothetical protein
LLYESERRYTKLRTAWIAQEDNTKKNYGLRRRRKKKKGGGGKENKKKKKEKKTYYHIMQVGQLASSSPHLGLLFPGVRTAPVNVKGEGN